MIIDFPHLMTVLATLATVVLCVLMHFEGLSLFGRWLTVERLPHRQRIVTLMFALIILHIAEIWVFAGTYYLLAQLPDFGYIAHYALAAPMIFVDYVYFSAVSYTSLGLGDLAPTGPIRFVTGTEALIGLLLIGWTVSFTYLEMQRYWGRD